MGGGCGDSFAPPEQEVPESAQPNATPAQRQGARRTAGLDPLRFVPDAQEEYESRAAAGFSRPLYVNSPGGVLATGERTARWRKLIEKTADASGIDADVIEGMVFLESAGRPEIVAGDGDLEGAAGLTQILADTATSQLGMRVDLGASRRLTDRIAEADRTAERGRNAGTRARAKKRAATLRARRREVDHRFDPEKALEGMARYLDQARRGFGREDLAVVSYHMGIGNLNDVVESFSPGGGDPKQIVENEDLSYAKLYFDSTPLTHRATYNKLAEFEDSSSNYYWRVLAAREIMKLYREDQGKLIETAELVQNKASSEEALHPPGSTQVFQNPAQLGAAYAAKRVVPFARKAGPFLLRARQMGELAKKIGQKPALYRGLRPEAMKAVRWIGYWTERISGRPANLIVTSTVRDRAYQKLLLSEFAEATSGYSLHTTGFAFDILRKYGPARERAFTFVLDRLQALNLIAYITEAGAIHICAASDAAGLPEVPPR